MLPIANSKLLTLYEPRCKGPHPLLPIRLVTSPPKPPPSSYVNVDISVVGTEQGWRNHAACIANYYAVKVLLCDQDGGAAYSRPVCRPGVARDVGAGG